jgi:hypothetical protein
MLRHLGVHGRHAGDVDDGVLGAGGHQGVEELLHDELGARRVEGAHQRHRDNVLPQPHDGGGQLQHGGRLVGDDLLPGVGILLEGAQPEVIDQPGEREKLGHQVGAVRHELVHRLLEGKHPERRLTGSVSVPGAGVGQLAKRRPELARGVLVRPGQRPDHESEEVF